MTSFFDLMKYAHTGIASPGMTAYDKARARAMAGGATVQTLTGIPPLSFKADGTPLISWSMKGNGSQQGTPTPSAPIQPEFVGVKTANLWDKGVPQYVYAKDYKKYNPDNAIALKAGTYKISSDGKLPFIQAFDGNHAQLSAADAFTYSSEYYLVWDGMAAGPRYSTVGSVTITLLSDCILTFTVADTLGTYIMLNLGSTALPYEPFGYKIAITCGGETTPVYLGQVNTVRRVKKLVFDGTEDWAGFQDAGTRCVARISLSETDAGVNTVTGYCSHIEWKSSYASGDLNRIVFSSSRIMYLSLESTLLSESSLTAFKSYLAAQYAAGNPVTVWYALANEETATVNEPLAKIGDYADELHSEDASVTIPTVKGANVLTVDTPIQPSEMTITYRE